MRLFVALNLSATSLRPLEHAQRELEKGAPGVYRWTDLGSVHLTLYFLGQIDEACVPEVAGRLGSIRAEPFQLGWGGLVVMPSPDVPKILAAGVIGDEHSLRALQRQVHDLVFPFAENKETRAFFPQATIGRLKRGVPASAKIVKRALSGFRLPGGTLETVSSFDLVKSEPSPTGSRHTVMHTYRLGVEP